MFVYNVKRMIRGLGDMLFSTNFQTLNVYAPAAALLNLRGDLNFHVG